ncbi:MAG: type IV toxin-antitoxin system AbiEi family antitoxin domain-containing protein, partial [candidate division Zixibacteria bacterium]|nr:type IV toxin-antitoxin system AbiEi family antitoxin domain-containing protein [candidate division Zixibacteria bacterium]
ELFGETIEIGNDDVERMLGVSDATATNYLQELEDEGKIEQIGERGRYVVYRMK